MPCAALPPSGVVLFHYLPYYDRLYGHQFELPALLESVLLFGRYGVHLFFILSGFVIFMTLERTRMPAGSALPGPCVYCRHYGPV